MPTYDYVCDACDHKFELFQSIKDDPIKKCPECAKKKLRRLFGIGAAIVFKGSGFYQTDYRSDSYKKQAASEKSSSEPKGDGKSESKGDSKPESKASESTPSSPDKPKSDAGASKSAKTKSND